jgi:GT2 family glycosyltransferase
MRRLAGPAGGPIRLVDRELSEPIAAIDATGYPRARALARLHGRPLGTVDFHLDGAPFTADVVAAAIWAALSGRIAAHCAADGLAVPQVLTASGLDHPGEKGCSWLHTLAGRPLPMATIVITTCGGPGSRLTSTLRGALAQSYPHFEVVVVDNRPGTSGVPEILAHSYPSQARLRYVAETRHGLSHARNCGAAAAAGELVAFTDDDVEIDPDWLGCLVAGFDDPRIACVTGLILPLELDTEAQLLLEEFGGYSKGFEGRLWDCDEHRSPSALYPYTAGAFGSGASAAFRRDALAEIGGFDGHLGAGTPALGGEDLDIYVTCVQRGYQIRYEPGAIIRHSHPRDLEQVRRKVRDYGVGLGAMLTKHLLRDWPTCGALIRRVPSGLYHLLSRDSTKNAARSATYPPSLIRAELAGLSYGPVAFFRSRRQL